MKESPTPPVPLNTLTRSDGHFVWVWSDHIGWRMYTIENAHTQVSDQAALAIPIPTPFALGELCD